MGYQKNGKTFFKTENKATRKQAKKLKKMKTFFVQLSCGCCEDVVSFAKEESIKKQFEEQGLQVEGVIVDDLGKKVEDVDTFYGYRTAEETELRSLGYLMSQL